MSWTTEVIWILVGVDSYNERRPNPTDSTKYQYRTHRVKRYEARGLTMETAEAVAGSPEGPFANMEERRQASSNPAGGWLVTKDKDYTITGWIDGTGTAE